MQNENSKQESFWYKIASNLSRPVVATVAIFIFILLNGYIFYNNFSTGKTVNEIVKDTNVQSSEFAVNVAGAFDLDGIEQ